MLRQYPHHKEFLGLTVLRRQSQVHSDHHRGCWGRSLPRCRARQGLLIIIVGLYLIRVLKVVHIAYAK